MPSKPTADIKLSLYWTTNASHLLLRIEPLQKHPRKSPQNKNFYLSLSLPLDPTLDLMTAGMLTRLKI